MDNQDWEEYEDLDWHNPMCNISNTSAVNDYYLECEEFDLYLDDCYLWYQVESCDLSNYTCTIYHSDGQKDCGEDLRDDEWWAEHSQDEFWFDDETPEIFAIWNFWDDYHNGDGDIDMDVFGDWFYEEYGEDLMLEEGT